MDSGTVLIDISLRWFQYQSNYHMKTLLFPAKARNNMSLQMCLGKYNNS